MDWKLDSPEKPKYCYYRQTAMFRLFFLQAWLLTARSQSKRLYILRSISLKKLSTLFLHWNPDWSQLPELVVLSTHLIFRTHVSPRKLTSFLVWRSQSEVFYLFRSIPFKSIEFILCKMDQKCKNLLFFWKCLDVQTHIFSLLYLLRFSITAWIDRFFYLRWTFFSISWKLFHTSELKCWKAIIGKSDISID